MIKPLRLIINGYKGRMGQALLNCASMDPELQVIARVDLVGDHLEQHLSDADAIVDFSHTNSLTTLLPRCIMEKKLLVIGTTGHSKVRMETIREASTSIPIVLAPNYSVGVNTLFWLVRKAAEILGPDFDLEVLEMHHRFKEDAPSGTAKRLAEILASVRGLNYYEHAKHGREGMLGERMVDEIGIHALRGGDVVGDHTVFFAGQGERVELTHRASSRDTFAKGALRAAKWAFGKPPGLYDMEDVLGLKD